MTNHELNALWQRIIESGGGGICYWCLSAWFARLAFAKGVTTKHALLVYASCLAVMGVASYGTAWSIYNQRPVTIAWFGFASFASKIVVACMALSATPKILFMLRMWADLLLKAPNGFADQTVHKVRVKPWTGVTSRFHRRKEAADGPPCP